MSVTHLHPDRLTEARASEDAATWQVGDDPGGRLFCLIGDVRLESGAVLPDAVLAYETWGELSPAGDNAVLIEHALTGDSHVCGPAGPGHATPGWWSPLVGPGAALDTDRWFVVAANVLGGCQGSTGPSTPGPDGRAWGSRFPRLTVRDQVGAEIALTDALGIERWQAVVGGSMGGMRALEWAATAPQRVATTVVLASTPAATAEQIAWAQAQTLAIRSDPHFAGGDYDGTGHAPDEGLALARRIAHVTYRSEQELDARFGRAPQGGADTGRFAVESYLDHHGAKLAGRFDANTYLVLTEAMNSHDVGRGRGGVAAALAPYTGRLVVAYVDSDRLYPPRLSEELAAAVPGSELRVIHSPVGHDGFLTEVEQVAQVVREALDLP